jgi:hypothetical protein
LAVDRLAESVHLVERLIGRRLCRARQIGPKSGQEDRVASQDLAEAKAIRASQFGSRITELRPVGGDRVGCRGRVSGRRGLLSASTSTARAE